MVMLLDGLTVAAVLDDMTVVAVVDGMMGNFSESLKCTVLAIYVR